MTRVGLVLGAGGTVGQAYHAGVLAALEHDLGWDPRSADVIVGTSAGSITGALLRLGVPAAELAAWAVQAPLRLDGGAVEDWLSRERPQFPPFTPRHWLRPWRPPSPALVAKMARRPWSVRPAVAALTCAPRGRVDLLVHAGALEELAGEWPEGLRVCAVRRHDGERVAFGAEGAPAAALATAVASSCAIPGYFAPVRIGGREYVDGGVHSPSNADALAGDELDVVIAVSPMSTSTRVRALDAPVRYAAHRRLVRELRRLERRGVTVVRFEPGGRSLAAMGINMMADDRADAVVQAAFIEAGGMAAGRLLADRLAPVRARAAAQ
ncbi:MAG TPA: patatin-like phospholipase family protein [Egibacteraceae bacterium]|nr:patatin-like phospholipase family protein [Egibacteraceae bacterium]